MTDLTLCPKCGSRDVWACRGVLVIETADGPVPIETANWKCLACRYEVIGTRMEPDSRKNPVDRGR